MFFFLLLIVWHQHARQLTVQTRVLVITGTVFLCYFDSYFQQLIICFVNIVSDFHQELLQAFPFMNLLNPCDKQ